MLIVASRRQLAGYFANLDPEALSLVNVELGAVEQLRRDECLVEFFQGHPQRGDLPSRIVIPDEEVEDFFAWTSTYAEIVTPLTGFVAVETRSEAMASPVPVQISERRSQALVGAVLMDGLLQSKARRRVPDTIVPACLRTLSAVFYQAHVVGSTQKEINSAVDLWATIRTSLKAAEMPFSTNHVLSFWRVLSSPSEASPGNDDLRTVVARYLENGTRDDPWRSTRWGPLIRVEIDHILASPREDRLRYVDERIKRVLESDMDRDVQAAFGGYLLSLVSNGDFSFWSTASELRDAPSMPLWFAFFSGGSESSNVLFFNQSIGRRLRNLLRFHSDDVDIDARELLISQRLRMRPDAAVDFPLSTHNVLKAKLAPRVCGWFSIRDGQPPDQPPVLESATRQILEARQLAERIMLLLNQVVHATPNSLSKESKLGQAPLALGQTPLAVPPVVPRKQGARRTRKRN